MPYGQTRCSCTTDGSSLNHLPLALPPPPIRPARPPDFAATAMQGHSCLFAIQAGPLLTCRACGEAVLTGSYSMSKSFGRQGHQATSPQGGRTESIGRGANLPCSGGTRCSNDDSCSEEGNRFGHGKGVGGVCGIMGCNVRGVDSVKRCGIGGVGVGCGTKSTRVGGLRCSVGRDSSRR